MSRAEMFSFRATDDLLDAIDEACDRAGLKKSMWVREVVAAVAFSQVSLGVLRSLVDVAQSGGQVHPARHLALQDKSGRMTQTQQRCDHPAGRIKRLPFTDVCGVCGVTVQVRG